MGTAALNTPSRTAALAGGNRHTAFALGLEILYPAGCNGRIGQIRLIQHIQMGLAPGDTLDLRVQAAGRDPGIQKLQNRVHMADIRFHDAQGFGHMAGKPLDLAPVDLFI